MGAASAAVMLQQQPIDFSNAPAVVTAATMFFLGAGAVTFALPEAAMPLSGAVLERELEYASLEAELSRSEKEPLIKGHTKKNLFILFPSISQVGLSLAPRRWAYTYTIASVRFALPEAAKLLSGAVLERELEYALHEAELLQSEQKQVLATLKESSNCRSLLDGVCESGSRSVCTS